MDYSSHHKKKEKTGQNILKNDLQTLDNKQLRTVITKRKEMRLVMTFYLEVYINVGPEI